MLFQSVHCRLLIQSKGNHVIGTQITRKLPRHNNRASAERAERRARIFIADDLTVAGLANIASQAFGFAILPCRTCF